MKGEKLNLVLLLGGTLGLIVGFALLVSSGSLYDTISGGENSSNSSALTPVYLGIVFISIICTALGAGMTMKKQLTRNTPETPEEDTSTHE